MNNSIKEPQRSSIILPISKKLWSWCFIVGLALWVIAILLWVDGTFDEVAVFYFNDARIAGDNLFVMVAQWLSSYGMPAISSIYVLYLITSYKVNTFDAPKAINFYVILSMALSGIAGDLLKLAIARPRPMTVFPDMSTLSQGLSSAMPSGHATKSIALAIPFIVLVTSKTIPNKVVKILAAMISMGVVVSRVIVGAHFVSDVVAGMGMAIFGLPLTMVFANMVLKQVDEKRLARLRIVWGVLLVALTVIFRLI